MPINEQFASKSSPEWSWGDPSQTAQAPEPLTTQESTANQPVASTDNEMIGRPWLDVIMGIVIFAVAQFFVGAIGVVVFMAINNIGLNDLVTNPQAIQGNPNLNAMLVWFVSVPTVLAVWGWAHVGNRTPKNFISWGITKQDILWGLGIVLLSAATNFLLTLAFGVRPEDAQNLNGAVWPKDIQVLPAIALALGISIIVPIAEEMIFRGMIQNAIERKTNAVVAIALSALIFAIPHIFNFIFLDIGTEAMMMGMTQILLLGAVLGFALVKTRRLAAPIFGHMFNNGLAAVTLLFATFMS